MFKKLADALCGLTCELGKWREQREREIKCHAGLATLADLQAFERRLVKAIGERIDPETLKAMEQKLSQSTDALQGAVVAGNK